MKQTNNAIKFLMAQYRAIFKNANIAMLAAIAASALAAGQAQAASTVNWKDIATGALDGTTNKKLEVVGSKDNNVSAAAGFELTLTGEHTIKGASKQNTFSTADGATTSITLNGDAASTSLTIGGSAADEFASVSITNLANDQGKLVLTGSGATTAETVLNAKTITVGKEATKAAVVEIGKFASLGGDDTTSLEVLAGGELKFADATSVAKSTTGVILNGGKITIDDAAAAKSGTIVGGLDVKSGTVTLGGSKQAGVLNVEGSVSVSGTDALNLGNASSKLSVKDGDITLEAGALKANAGTIEISTSANKTASLTFDAADYATVFAGKVGVAAADATGKLALNIVGEDEIELSTIVSGDAGTLKDTIEKSGINGASFTISANNVKFTDGAKLAVGAADLNFGSLAAGKSGALSIDAGNVTVNDALTVTASGDTSDLSVTATGSLTLDAKGQSGSITAKTITANATNNTDKALNIKGTWGTAANITVTKGVVSLNGATLNLTGKLAAADSTNGTVVADNSTINTVGDGSVALSGGTLTLQNNARLELDKLDLLKDGGSGKLVLDGDKFAQDSVIGGGNTTIALMDGKNKVSMTVADFNKLKSDFGTKFTGLFEVELSDIATSDAKPVEGMSLDKVVSNASIDAYNNTGVTVENGATPVQVSASVGNVHVKTENDLSLGAGGALTLNKANANGQFVSKKSDDGTALSNVTFNSADNALVLGGTGEIGAIKTDSGVKGSFTVGTASAKGTVTVKGDVGASASEIKTVTVQKDNNLVVNGSVFTQALGVGENGSIDVGSSGNITTQSAKISGDVTANTLTISGAGSSTAPQANYFNGNSTIDVSKLVLGANNTLDIGKDKVGQDAGSFAHVYADTFVFEAGSSLFVDPEYGGPASLLAVQKITNDAGKTDVQTVSGKAYIGKNAALGIGFTDAEFGDLMADYLTVNGGFNENGDVKNALALNAPITIANNNGIVINPEADRAALDGAFKENQVAMSGKSALILTDKAFGEKKR